MHVSPCSKYIVIVEEIFNLVWVFFIPQTALDPPRLRVLVVGLDQSGKTAFVECLEKGKKEILKSEPTDCFSMKFVTIGDIMFDIWDGKKESLFSIKIYHSLIPNMG